MKYRIKNIFIVSVVILVVCILGVVCLYPWSRFSADSFKQTKEIGDEIVTSIKAYQKDHNKYPVTLDELKPYYLTKIQKPTWGIESWHYVVIDDGEFVLSVGENKKMYPVLFYHSGSGHWSYDN